MAKTNKVMVGVDDQVTELTGFALEAFEADRAQMRAYEELLETEYKAKQKAREDAIKKLAEVAGLTEEQITLLIQGI